MDNLGAGTGESGATLNIDKLSFELASSLLQSEPFILNRFSMSQNWKSILLFFL